MGDGCIKSPKFSSMVATACTGAAVGATVQRKVERLKRSNKLEWREICDSSWDVCSCYGLSNNGQMPLLGNDSGVAISLWRIGTGGSMIGTGSAMDTMGTPAIGMCPAGVFKDKAGIGFVVACMAC